MKKLLMVFCIVVIALLCSISALAAETDNSGTWEYQTCGSGVELTKYNGSQSDIYIPSEIEDANTSLPVVKLGNELFKGNTALNSATLGEGISEIGNSAFEGATNLVCIVTTESLTTIGKSAFSGCTNFNSIILYDTVTNIGADAFANCKKLAIYCNKNTIACNYAITNNIAYSILNSVITPEIHTVDGVTYYILNGEAVVTTIDKSLTDIVIPAYIKGYPVKDINTAFKENKNIRTVVLPNGLSVIKENAFLECTALTSIVIPDSVISIGRTAFDGCIKLKNITWSKSLQEIGYEAFDKCNSITQINLPSSLKKLGTRAFGECSSLTYVTLPEGLSEVDNGVFSYCTNLTTVKIPTSMTYVGYAMFTGCSKLKSVELHSGITSIKSSAFYSCTSLTTINIPEGVTDIGESAFYDCRSLTKIKLPYGITSIRRSTFSLCALLTDVEIPTGVVSIENNAFSGCSSLKTITLPETVATIGNHAFTKCTSLTEIIIPANVTEIQTDTFDSGILIKGYSETYAESFCYENGFNFVAIDGNSETVTVNNVTYRIVKDKAYVVSANMSVSIVVIPSSVNNCAVVGIQSAFKNHTALTSITLPETIETIGAYAFQGCSNLAAVNIPDSVTYIGKYAFAQCSKLYNPVLSKNIVVIDDFAFQSCSKITEIQLYSGITTIGNSAFSSCTKLETITLPSDTLVKIGDSAFHGCTSLKSITIPNSVITLGISVFYNCKVLQTVKLSDNIESLEASVFAYCSALKSIEIPNKVEYIGNHAFLNCSLESIELPESVKTIGTSTFENCFSLKKVELSEGLETIGSHAFYSTTVSRGYSVPESIKIPNSVISISNMAFSRPTILIVDNNSYGHKYATDNDCAYIINNENVQNEYFTVDNIRYYVNNGEAIILQCLSGNQKIIIPEKVNGYKVTSCRDAFKNNTALTEIVLPEGLETIKKEAFSGCTSLKKITIPNSVKYIGNKAFYECKAMVLSSLPSNLEQIGTRAFGMCTSLTSIKIPGKITEISELAFSQCPNLVSLEIQEGVTVIGKSAFSACSFLTEVKLPESLREINYRAFQGCYSLPEISIPSEVYYIGEGAFMDCSNLKKATLPLGIANIEPYTFYGCNALDNVIIPYGVESVGEYAFTNCYAPVKLEIPDTVKTIGQRAFYGWKNLKTVKMSENLETINHMAFYRSDGIVSLVMPSSIKKAYKDSLPEHVIWIVASNSYTHTFAKENNLLYFVIKESENPETSYGINISGTATYTDGTAASGANVEILYDDGTVKENVSTDANGNYEFTYAEVGRYTIRITDKAGNTASEIISVKRMTVFDVYLAGDTDLILKKGYTVSGTVSPKTATVSISDAKGNIIKIIDTSDGTFTFENIAKGEYIIKAETENGSKTVSVYVSNEDVTDVNLVVEEQSASISGGTKIENRDGTYTTKNWISIELFNSENRIVASAKTIEGGMYEIKNLPLGTYNIVATTSEMRPAYGGNFEKSFELKGYGYIEITEPGEYHVDTIILREEKINLNTISGKAVTNAKGRVIISDEDGNQLQVFNTKNDGEFEFINIPDGLYVITAVTDSEGMGFVIITLESGKNYNDIKIQVTKANNVKKFEEMFDDIPDEINDEDKLKYKEPIQALKKIYDNMSKTEREQVSEAIVEKMYKYINAFANYNITVTSGISVDNEESLIESQEFDEAVEFVLSVTETEEINVGSDGITTSEEYEAEKIKDKKGKNKEIAKYYDITLSKNGQNISSIQKQTETSGKLLITMEIPEEYRGHKNYSFIHMHKGEATTLADLDDNPDTVTFEIDKFSTFALAYSDIEMIGEVENGIYPASITYNEETGTISVSSTEDSTLHIATYEGDELTDVVSYPVSANAVASDYKFTSNQAAFVLTEDSNPLCKKFTISK